MSIQVSNVFLAKLQNKFQIIYSVTISWFLKQFIIPLMNDFTYFLMNTTESLDIMLTQCRPSGPQQIKEHQAALASY